MKFVFVFSNASTNFSSCDKTRKSPEFAVTLCIKLSTKEGIRFCVNNIKKFAAHSFTQRHGNRSVYYTKKEPECREIYKIKRMKYLTSLDYSLFKTQSKNLEARLSEKEQEIQLLRQRDAMNTEAISALSDQLSHVMKEIELLKQEKI